MLNARRSSPRSGFTLVELLVALVLLGIVAGGMMGIIVRQQQFYSGSSGVLETRASVRDGLAMLVGDLRALSPRNGDIYTMGRTFIDFRLGIGSGVVCTISSDRRTLTIPPLALANKNGLTSWISAPQSGDSTEVYDPGTTAGTSDDHWIIGQLSAAASSGAGCPTSTGLTTTTGEASSGWSLSLNDTVSTTVAVGSPVHFFRHARYELFQASDGLWYLGYRDCLPTRSPACQSLAPVSGPYLAAAASGPSGLEFTYFDSTGAVTATPALVRRIGIVTRAQSSNVVHSPGRTPGYYQDSLATSLAVRN